jgi:hypothetical protein
MDEVRNDTAANWRSLAVANAPGRATVKFQMTSPCEKNLVTIPFKPSEKLEDYMAL